MATKQLPDQLVEDIYRFLDEVGTDLMCRQMNGHELPPPEEGSKEWENWDEGDDSESFDWAQDMTELDEKRHLLRDRLRKYLS